MSEFTIEVENLRGLRHVRWSPAGHCLLVGANGAGKTTLLLVLKLLRAAVGRGLPQAVQLVLGGSQGLKHREAADDEPIKITVDLGELRWSVTLTPQGSSVDYLTDESLSDGETLIFSKDSLGNFEFDGQSLKSGKRLGLRTVYDSQFDSPQVVQMVDWLRGLRVYHDPDLWALRGGSDVTQNRWLHSRGQNALTMLRQWFQQRSDRHRYQFVLQGLQAAFPGLIEDVDFVEAGNTLAMQVYRPGREAAESLGTEANGVLSMLINLCCLASAEPGSVVAIDEPENALHPFAIRAFARAADAVARKFDVCVLSSTHSTVLLDHFNDTPSKVFVLDREAWPGPVALPTLRDPEWLAQFRLGELYTEGEIANNDPRG